MVEVVDQIQLILRTMHRLDCPAPPLLRNLREMLRQADLISLRLSKTHYIFLIILGPWKIL